MEINEKDWKILKEKLKQKWLIHNEIDLDYKDYFLTIETQEPFYSIHQDNNAFDEIELTEEQIQYIDELVCKDTEANEKLELERKQDARDYERPYEYFGVSPSDFANMKF